ncbi:MAG: hypothetical protein HY699_10345 [Deltaproteobacteria bacterium]|nr:hypothetical protein [Deltaproteobacteria bacterium]
MSAAPPLRPPTRLSALCMACAGVAFLTGWLLVVLAAPDMVAFFYQPRVLAITHTFTLGWISLSMIGVLYQYVPSLTKSPLAYPRLAGLQVGLFILGAAGMVAHFWMGRLNGMAWSAGVVLASVLLFAGLLAPSLARAPRYDATVIGISVAVASFVGTAALGVLYAIDKVYPFLAGSVLSNIAAHAHLGLLGWITLTICAVSYRMVAAFLLPEVLFPAATRRQILLLAGLMPVLLTTLLSRWQTATFVVGCLVAIALAWYVIILWRLLQGRRMPVDWTLAHVLAALVHLAAAIGCGLALVVLVDPGSALGNRLVLAYGIFALSGWISNFIIGMATRMVPGLVGKGARPLLSERGRALLFGLLNAGIAAAAMAALSASAPALRLAALLPLAAGLLFCTTLLRRLSRPRPTS